MSEKTHSPLKKADVLKSFATTSALSQDEVESPTGSPSLRKKNTIFGSLRHTMRKNKTIEVVKDLQNNSDIKETTAFVDQKEGDAERIRLLKSVKEGTMTIEEAMKQAKYLGVSQTPIRQESSDESLFNFGIYKYTKNRASCSRGILQFDFQEKVLCIIQKGSRGRKFVFSHIRGFDCEDGVRFDIYFEDYHAYDLDADTIQEKSKICTILESIINQNKADELDGVFQAPVFGDKKVIKEGLVEKKGHSAAFLMWPRRWLRVQEGELSYFKIGDENQSALNIIKLTPGKAAVKKMDNNGFIITTNKKEYSFRVVVQDPLNESCERDEWITAISKGSQPLISPLHKSCGSVFEDSVLTNSIQQQEEYIKDVVKTLQRELEQLASVLCVVNAPIQATVQVKKVNEIVSKMDTHVKTGLLSFAMRQLKYQCDESTNHFSTPSKICESKVIKEMASNKPINKDYKIMSSPENPTDLHCFVKSPSSVGVNEQQCYDTVPKRSVVASPEAGVKCPLSVPVLSPSSQASNHCKHLSETKNTYSSQRCQNRCEMPATQTYQQKSTDLKIRDVRLEAYDNVNISNLPASHSLNQSLLGNDTMGEHEVDSGGMSCQTLHDAVQERKEFYEENKDVSNDIKSEEEVTSAKPVPTLSLPLVPPPPPLPETPGIGLAPPPPPIGGGIVHLDSALPSRRVATPNAKLRPFFWNKVPLQMVTQSMWLGASDRTSVINIESLEEMFQIKEQDKDLTQASSKPASRMLLDSKKAHNLGIFLSGFKLSAREIKEKLSVLRDGEGALSVEHIMALKRFLPTPEEQEMYKNIKEEEIHTKEDKFMIKLCEIPDLDKRLDLLFVIMEFPSKFQELAPVVSYVLDACHMVYSSQRFQVVLEYVLAIGNYLNGGTNRGGAYGIRLTSLPKMADIKSCKNKKNTLLTFLITELQRCSPDTLLFVNDLKPVSNAENSSIKGLSAEVEVMRKDLQKIKKHSSDLLLKYKQTEAQDIKLVRDVDKFVLEYEEKLRDLSEKCKEMKYIYSKLLMRFGEAANTDSEELFTALSTFINQFQKTKAELKISYLDNNQSEVTQVRYNSTSQVVSIQSKQETNITEETLKEIHESSNNKGAFDSEMNRQKSLLCVNHAQTQLLTRPTKEGYLEKLSGGKHKAPKWDSRYFELSVDGHLRYYKKSEGRVINTIYLRGCPVFFDDEDPTIIRIKTDDREWSLKGSTVADTKLWKESLDFYACKSLS